MHTFDSCGLHEIEIQVQKVSEVFLSFKATIYHMEYIQIMLRKY